MLSSPLRYPGGKARLYPFLSDVIRRNGLFGCTYCEPYAGGAGLALRLLSTGFVSRIKINDIDPAIHAFWIAVTQHNEELCRKIISCEIAIEEWHRQQAIYRACDREDVVSLAFSAFFLNRTNRSGIIEGAGPVGGYAQAGAWRLDARFDREKQLAAIRALKPYAPYIDVHCKDALDFSNECFDDESAIVYLDPPYFVKGHKLYRNFYTADDHREIRDVLISKLKSRWILSYDDVAEIRHLYANLTPIEYELSYSAGRAGKGREVIFVSEGLEVDAAIGLKNVA